MGVIKGKDGQFKRTRLPWTIDNWNDGYVDNRGRFRVYRPDYPWAYKGGYAFRAHVVWWLTHGTSPEKGTDIHHINHNRLDDRAENLTNFSHLAHSIIHHKKGFSFLVCEKCGVKFKIATQKVNSRIHEGTPVRFCSQACYHAHPRSETHKAAISAGGVRRHAQRRSLTTPGSP